MKLINVCDMSFFFFRIVSFKTNVLCDVQNKKNNVLILTFLMPNNLITKILYLFIVQKGWIFIVSKFLHSAEFNTPCVNNETLIKNINVVIKNLKIKNKRRSLKL